MKPGSTHRRRSLLWRQIHSSFTTTIPRQPRTTSLPRGKRNRHGKSTGARSRHPAFSKSSASRHPRRLPETTTLLSVELSLRGMRARKSSQPRRSPLTSRSRRTNRLSHRRPSEISLRMQFRFSTKRPRWRLPEPTSTPLLRGVISKRPIPNRLGLAALVGVVMAIGASYLETTYPDGKIVRPIVEVVQFVSRWLTGREP